MTCDDEQKGELLLTSFKANDADVCITCIWHNPTRNSLISGSCFINSSVIRCTPLNWGLRCTFLWNHPVGFRMIPGPAPQDEEDERPSRDEEAWDDVWRGWDAEEWWWWWWCREEDAEECNGWWSNRHASPEPEGPALSIPMPDGPWDTPLPPPDWMEWDDVPEKLLPDWLLVIR